MSVVVFVGRHGGTEGRRDKRGGEGFRKQVVNRSINTDQNARHNTYGWATKQEHT
jgi:hypothetical protein